MTQTILSRPATEPDSWEPKWTVITSAPNLAEQWATRVVKRFRQAGGPAIPVCTFVYVLIRAVDDWSKGQYQALTFDVLLTVLVALNAWERYGFGQLFARYEAELHELQSRQNSA